MRNITASVNESLTVDGLGRLIKNFPKSPFSNNSKNISMKDALFCGSYESTVNASDDNFGPKFRANSFIVNLEKQFKNFIANLMPSQKQTEKGVCGNITVNNIGQCPVNLLNFKEAKFLMQGYILVTPDTPLVRSLIDSLDKPLRYANLLRDLLVDMNQVSIEMQNEIGRSLLIPFISVSNYYFS